VRGLSLRISLIVAAATAILVVVAMAAVYVQRTRGDEGALIQPLPDRIAAIVELIEATPPDGMARVLRAVNSPTLRVTVADAAPPALAPGSAPEIAWLVGRRIATLTGRPVEATFEPAAARDATGGGERPRAPLRVAVALNDGRFAVIQARSAALYQFTGLRVALGVLMAALAVSGISLWALRRQIRPLETLARAVERCGDRLELPPIEDRGAREIRQLVSAITGMQARIRDLLAGRTRMVAAIGHDFRTYLTRLRLRADFIADPVQRERAIRDLDDMHALVTDTLTLAALEHDAEPAERVDLAALARHHAAGFSAAGGPVRIEAPPEGVFAELRPVAIGRALTNLIANALKYGSRADVTIAQVDADAILVVEDRGPGIPAAERGAVLEPFYRRDPARNLDAAGSGLGLAIVADITRRHGGTIALEDRDGGGLRVRIRLPLAGAQPGS